MAALFRKNLIVDPEDQHIVDKHTWHESGPGKHPATKINGKSIRLHKLILPEAKTIDHINRNVLDARKENLRECSQAENILNRGVFKNSKTGLKGVCWHKQSGTFRATIQIAGKKVHLGNWDCPIKAAQAYDKAAVKYHGEFAVLNGDKGVQGAKPFTDYVILDELNSEGDTDEHY